MDRWIKEFAGYRVVNWKPGRKLEQPESTNYKIRYDENKEEEWTELLARFLADPASREVTGLVIGTWTDPMSMQDTDIPAAIVEALVAAADRLPALTRIFFGDIILEESDITWIGQTEMGMLLAAYPRLEHFGVRSGEEDLSFQQLKGHPTLKTLITQSAGLSSEVVRQVLAADLPALEHLELWLGIEEFFGDTTVADLHPLLAGDRFPNLRYLGLRNSEIADELAVALAAAPILERIEVLDLSLGTLSDAGAEALLHSPAVAHLHKLDLHHHYCSPEMMKRLKALPIAVNLRERHEAEEQTNGEMRRFVDVRD